MKEISANQYCKIDNLMVQLKKIRQNKNISLTEMSNKTGLTRAAISRLENGWMYNPQVKTLFIYCEALKLDSNFKIKKIK